MADNREIQNEPNWVIYDGPPSFLTLVKLNEGALLAPLVSVEPIETLDPFIRAGMASLPGKATEITLGQYSADEMESARLIKRFRQIRHFEPSLEKTGYPLSPLDIDDKFVDPSKERKTPAEMYREVLFGFGAKKPAFHRIPAIMRNHPRDPETIHTLEATMLLGGIDLASPDQNQELGSFVSAVGIGLNQHVFDKFRRIPREELLQMGIAWAGSIDKPRAAGVAGIHLGMLDALQKRVDPELLDPTFASDYMSKVLDAARDASERMADPARARYLLRALFAYSQDRILMYKSEDQAILRAGPGITSLGEALDSLPFEAAE